MNRIQRLRQSESGMSLVFIGLGMMAFISASMLAIDVGMMMTARSQAQNSADAGALAGATALLYDSFTDHSAGGPAVTNAIRAAQTNNVMAGQVSVTAADVEFLTGPVTGQQDRVKVTVRRTASRGNPVATMIARYFGMANTDIGATATAEAAPANAMSCVKPFTIPDKWAEHSSPPWNSLTSTFDAYDNKGNPLPPGTADVYVPANQPGYTGYTLNDVGTYLTIRAGTGNNINPSMYFSLAMTNDTGGSDYRNNIMNCNRTHYHWGEPEVLEPGNMMGPTVQGITDLIAQDKDGAHWVPSAGARGQVQNAAGQLLTTNPRIFPIPLYDPAYYAYGKVNGRNADLRTANWICFFADNVSGNNITGVIVPCRGEYDKNGPAPNNASPRAIRLVQ